MLMDKKKIFYNNPEIWGGIECTINRVKDAFFDQVDYAGFYQNPSVSANTDLGIKKLRFPILWEKHQPEHNGEIDWNWTEQQIDQFKKDDHRKLSVICYLNHDWKDECGGQLRMYLPDGNREVLPVAGRLVCFRSDQIEHEVLPATRDRFSLTGWILDQHSDLRHI